jgi:hypothetical protein
MKELILALIIVVPAHSATLWTENFELFDVGVDNLEQQSGGAWLTDPIGTSAIAVVANSGLPLSFGNKSLAVGGLPTDGTETLQGVAYALAPEVTGFDPVLSSPETELSFSVSLVLNTGSGAALADAFRLSFTDINNVALATLLFTQALDNNGDPVPGFATVIRSNMAQSGGVFDTQSLITVNEPFTLNLVMSPLLNKWSGSIDTTGGAAFSMFSNVDMTLNEGPPQPDATVGSFSIDWLKGGSQWGDNYLLADNFSLQSQIPIPEPGVPLMISGLALASLLVRKRN